MLAETAVRWWMPVSCMEGLRRDAWGAGSARVHAGVFHAVDDRGRALAQELHPLLLQRAVVLRRLDQVEEALDRALEPLLQGRVRQPPVLAERLVRLRQREH